MENPSVSLDSIFRSAHRELKPRTPVPEIRAEYFPFAGLTHTARFRNQSLFVRVSDVLKDAPAAVIQALALILLSKLYRRQAATEHQEAYRGFILQGDIQERARAARLSRGRRRRLGSPQGRWRDLETAFDRLNVRYFGGAMVRPSLGWSSTRSRRILGRYDATHRVIVISLLFDSPLVPEFVLEYVLYHEMLHAKYPARAENCRMVAHPPEFRAEERRFEQYREASAWIRRI